MKNATVASITVIALALLVGLAVPQYGFSQQEDQLFQGELVAVDTEQQTITVQGAEDMRMTFAYNAETQVGGAETSIQGLSGQTGTQVRVSYTPGESPLAKQILVIEE